MKQSLSKLCLLVCLSIARNYGMMIRNNALMSKMVSDFHAPKAKTEDIMRNVLCKNFPSIPCKLITKDDALRSLIQKTIRLLNEKQRNLQNGTTTTEQQTQFPVVNSDELSQYLAVENTGYFTDKHKHNKERRIDTPKTGWPKDVDKGAQRRGVPGHKNIKKYFPHKIKYKDRNEISNIAKSREKISNSEEILNLDGKKYDNFNYKEPINMPMWQIDYTKHGDPKIPNFSEESDQLRGKLVKIGSDTTSTGRPAVQLFTELFKQKGDSWVSWHNTVTTGDGRIQFPFTKDSMSAGTYKLKFNVGDYYTKNGKETLYPYVEIVFEVKENEHYHIPLLLSPYGYSTYRGS
ncbi:uncharacterized protein LOC133516242 [Cydia pomonella]|uniref:uncharacterized protein LOC133516242 n=1 Tax=Cydia pomonella TaxID=82600 RepID=UPI002ADDA7BA|nr:uncharacterized protein LOC133516242 [Cydia pomonella]